jgi:hypothetical protein
MVIRTPDQRVRVFVGSTMGELADERQAELTYGQPFDAYLRYYLGRPALVRGDLDAARPDASLEQR